MARASSSQFIPLRSLLRLLRRYDVDPKYRKRARGRVVFSLLTTPFRLWERVRYGRLIRNTRIPDAPVFLNGDTTVEFGVWLGVLDLLRQAGIKEASIRCAPPK